MQRTSVEENRQAGTRDWWLRRTAVHAGRSRAIEGYAFPYSAAPGETLDFRVSAAPAGACTADVFRLGWYGGMGARRLTTLGPFQAAPQPDPARGPRGERECAWPVSARLTIPDDWASGVHLLRLTRRDDGAESYILFVVRPGARVPPVIVQTSDFCWQAYNRWPDDRSCLYDTEWWLAKLWPLMQTADTRLRSSFERPMGMRKWDAAPPLLTGIIGSGEYLQWEFPLAFWLEREGFDVGYATNFDGHRAGVPDGAKAWISVGHDEYWSRALYDRVTAARDRGVHLLFLSGNSVFTEVEFSPSSAGAADRVIRRKRMFSNWEAPLMGVANGFAVVGDDDWRCAAPEHWLFEGTGMKAGEGIPNLVGWETHTRKSRVPGLAVVGSGRVPLTIRGLKLGSYRWYSTSYTAPSGAHVFAASTIYWPLGLARPPVPLAGHPFLSRVEPDPRVERMTRNLLRRAGVDPAV